MYHLLIRNRWPGNVRELENAIERAVLVAKGSEIAVDRSAGIDPRGVDRRRPTSSIPPHRTLAEIEKMAILQTLQRTNWNKQEAAQILGLYRPTLYSKMKKHEIRDAGKSGAPRRERARPSPARPALAQRLIDRGRRETRGARLAEFAKEGDVEERSRVLLATMLGAVAGGVWGWLYLTEPGGGMRSQIEPKLDDFVRELSNVRGTVEKAVRGQRRLAVAERDRRERNAGPLVRVTLEETRCVDLHTTNLLLGIMAAMSVLEGLAVMASAIGGFIDLQAVLELAQLVTDSKRGRSRRCVSKRRRDPRGRQDGDGARQRADRAGRSR